MIRSWFARVAGCSALLVLGFAAQPAAGQQRASKSSAAPSAPSAAKPTPVKVDYAQRYNQVCAACHGTNGRSDMAGTPVLAGQPSLYVITQLFLFREGRRDNEAMTAIAKTMTDEDLRGFSDYIGTLPPVPAPAAATPPDPVRMAKGKALAEQHKCLFCHGSDFGGGQQVPRIAGQREDYLQASLRGFHSGKRAAYTQAMPAAVSQLSEEDLDTLAYFAARFPGSAATK